MNGADPGAATPLPEPLERLVVIVIGDPGPVAWRALRHLAPHVLCVAVGEAGPAVLERADAVFAWDFRSTSLADLWPSLPRVAWVHAASAGVDHLLFPALLERATMVTNSAGVFDRPIAEYVLGLLLMHAKGFRATLEAQAGHRWDYRETRDIAGARLVVVGLGRIGRAVAQLARACGMQVVAVRREAADDPDADVVYGTTGLRDAVGDADFVVVTVARTLETRRLIDAGVIAAMRPSAFLVNVSRGDAVDAAALATALRDGRLGGAALDVFDVEPLPPDDPLWTTPNLIVSPHMSGDSTGWDDRVIELFADNARRQLAGVELRNRVDTARGY